MTAHGMKIIAAATLALITLAGCSVAPEGRYRELGNVSYTDAFAAATEVMKQYYTVEDTDPLTGTIQAKPLAVDEKGERILGGNSPARQLAKITLRNEGGIIVAYASVAVQRQGADTLRQMRTTRGQEDYSTVPNQSPAYDEAATTAEQNENWMTYDYAHDLETKILDDLYRSLHPNM